MKRLVLLLPLVVTAACAYPPMSVAGAYQSPYPMSPRSYGPQVNLAAPPIGRWDNVMMTAVGTRLFVLMMNSDTASGEIVTASDDNLRLHVAAGVVDLPASRVMRVDRITTGRDVVKDGARGAAFGAGVVGVLGLIAGHVPPVRLFAAGGIVGADQNVQNSFAAKGATIYLARGAMPSHPAPQTAPAPTASLHVGPSGVIAQTPR